MTTTRDLVKDERDQFLTHRRFASRGDAQTIPTVNGRAKEPLHGDAPVH